MLNLVGEYQCKMDDKGRVKFPVSLKKQLIDAGEEGSMVVTRGPENCLRVYPMSEWKKVTQQIRSKNLYVSKNRNFARYFLRGSSVVDFDSLDRILIPKSLKEDAKLEKELIVIGFFDNIEIWSKEVYESSAAIMPDNYEDLMEEVMSDEDVKKEKEEENE